MNVMLNKTIMQHPVLSLHQSFTAEKVTGLNFIPLKHHLLMLCDKTHGPVLEEVLQKQGAQIHFKPKINYFSILSPRTKGAFSNLHEVGTVKNKQIPSHFCKNLGLSYKCFHGV